MINWLINFSIIRCKLIVFIIVIINHSAALAKKYHIAQSEFSGEISNPAVKRAPHWADSD